MDTELIKAVAEAVGAFPIIGVLIYLLVRETNQKEKLLTMLVDQQCQHTKDIIEMVRLGFEKRIV